MGAGKSFFSYNMRKQRLAHVARLKDRAFLCACQAGLSPVVSETGSERQRAVKAKSALAMRQKQTDPYECQRVTGELCNRMLNPGIGESSALSPVCALSLLGVILILIRLVPNKLPNDKNKKGQADLVYVFIPSSVYIRAA